MNEQQADRIIVKSNARMQMVLDWYFENKSWLDKAEFHAPLESGIIELREEQIKVTFENKGNVVELSIVPMLKPNLPPIVIFDYDPQTWMASNYRFAPAPAESEAGCLAAGHTVRQYGQERST